MLTLKLQNYSAGVMWVKPDGSNDSRHPPVPTALFLRSHSMAMENLYFSFPGIFASTILLISFYVFIILCFYRFRTKLTPLSRILVIRDPKQIAHRLISSPAVGDNNYSSASSSDRPSYHWSASRQIFLGRELMQMRAIIADVINIHSSALWRHPSMRVWIIVANFMPIVICYAADP